MNYLNREFLNFVGFDQLLNGVKSATNYPPYNLIRTSDDEYIIELTVAGFKKSEVAVTLDDNLITIKGTRNKEPVINQEYVHRGLGTRDFTRQFQLAEHIVITSAAIQDGILRIVMEKQVPEDKKVKVIDIA